MVLGYDARQFANAEPWVDTHRIEAIDARLHALHQERARGELAYALEKDAAAEARRIRAEEDAALAAIREAIGLREGATVDAGATLSSEKRSGFRVKGRSLEKLRARRVKGEKAEKGESALDALAVAAKNLGYHYAEGITQSKDSFYGQHEPENMPAESRLKERWEAWRRGNVMTSEMEAAALFVISSIRGCRAASIMSFVDMKKTVEVARDALKILIRQDAAK